MNVASGSLRLDLRVRILELAARMATREARIMTMARESQVTCEYPGLLATGVGTGKINKRKG